MRRALPALLCLLGALAGCEDTGISNVARREMINAKALMQMQGSTGAILIEIHGAPWEGADRAEIAGTLRMPEGPGRGVRFREVPPGQGLIGEGTRLILVFNPRRQANVGRYCHATEEIETAPPDGDGFRVDGVFCRGTDWVVRASFDAEVSENDWLAYYLEMQVLLGVMFPNR